MTENPPADYLAGLPAAQRTELEQVNAGGMVALREYLAAGTAVAFLGAGVSAPLYPLWDGLIGQLVDAAAGLLDDTEAATCRAMARESPAGRRRAPGMDRVQLRRPADRRDPARDRQRVRQPD